MVEVNPKKILKYGLFSVVGLSIGFVIGIILFLYVNFEFGYRHGLFINFLQLILLVIPTLMGGAVGVSVEYFR